MRTTVTLDPDTAAIVRRIMREQDITFKAALNQAIRSGQSGGERVALRTRSMGRPRVDIEHALAVVGELEDSETVREIRARR